MSETKNENDSQAFPCLRPTGYTHGNGSPEMEMVSGLTKREWFAGMALSGITVHSYNQTDTDQKLLAKIAFGIADAMIKAGE